jgi:hypothetical protein
MGKLGTTEIVILLMVFIAVPFICYRLGYTAGRVLGERDALQRQVGQGK